MSRLVSANPIAKRAVPRLAVALTGIAALLFSVQAEAFLCLLAHAKHRDRPRVSLPVRPPPQFPLLVAPRPLARESDPPRPAPVDFHGWKFRNPGPKTAPPRTPMMH